MEKICYIVGAGDNSGTNFLKGENDLVIAADGGLTTLERMNIIPDIIMGDFDSLGYVPKGDNVFTHPVMKDETDTGLALKKAMELGYTHIVIFGGTGGRIDHTIANFQNMLYASRKGVYIEMKDSRHTYTVVTNKEITIKGEYDSIFSVFAIGVNASDVSIENALYNIKDYDITSDFPIGTSNRFVDKGVKISVNDGSILIIY